MTVLLNNFDGGPDATAITTSNSGQVPGNDAFDAVNSGGTGVVLEYASVDVNVLERPTAEYCLKLATGSTLPASGVPSVAWTTAMGNQSTIYTRFYVYLADINISAPGDEDINLFRVVDTANQFKAVGVWLQTVTTPHYLGILNEWNSVATFMSSAPLVAGVWQRIEFRATVTSNPNNGSAELYYYADADSPIATDSVSQTSQNYGTGTVDMFSLGQGAGSQRNTAPIYLSNWELNDTDWPGPAPFRPGKGVPGILTNPIAIHTDAS